MIYINCRIPTRKEWVMKNCPEEVAKFPHIGCPHQYGLECVCKNHQDPDCDACWDEFAKINGKYILWRCKK